jgi:cytochrome c peroxidase
LARIETGRGSAARPPGGEPAGAHAGTAGGEAAGGRAGAGGGDPRSAARVALGRDLFFETRLSADGTLACASCHLPSRGFADRRAVSAGVGGRPGRRNAPTLLNVGSLPLLLWDGAAGSLEEQAARPITDPDEMGAASPEAAVASMAAVPRYRRAFRRAFGRPVAFADLVSALASFERTLVFLASPIDRFLAGEPAALSPEAARGHALFMGKALCAACHRLGPGEPLGTDHLFHNLGVAARHPRFGEVVARRPRHGSPPPNSAARAPAGAIAPPFPAADLALLGRFAVSGEEADLGAFRTPALRNVGITAPYMHDGSFETLWDVLDFYNRGGEPNPYLDEAVTPLKLGEEEIDQLVAFLFSLTDDAYADLNGAEQERQREIAARRPGRIRRRRAGPCPSRLSD